MQEYVGFTEIVGSVLNRALVHGAWLGGSRENATQRHLRAAKYCPKDPCSYVAYTCSHLGRFSGPKCMLYTYMELTPLEWNF